MFVGVIFCVSIRNSYNFFFSRPNLPHIIRTDDPDHKCRGLVLSFIICARSTLPVPDTDKT